MAIGGTTIVPPARTSGCSRAQAPPPRPPSRGGLGLRSPGGTAAWVSDSSRRDAWWDACLGSGLLEVLDPSFHPATQPRRLLDRRSRLGAPRRPICPPFGLYMFEWHPPATAPARGKERTR